MITDGGEEVVPRESPDSPLESPVASMLFSSMERRIGPVFARLR